MGPGVCSLGVGRTEHSSPDQPLGPTSRPPSVCAATCQRGARPHQTGDKTKAGDGLCPWFATGGILAYRKEREKAPMGPSAGPRTPSRLDGDSLVPRPALGPTPGCGPDRPPSSQEGQGPTVAPQRSSRGAGCPQQKGLPQPDH